MLVPNGDNYVPATPQMLTAVRDVSDGVLAGRPAQVDAILDALGVKYILLRGDIDPAQVPTRRIVDPAALDAAMAASPAYRLIVSEGPLHLYALSGSSNDASMGTPIFTNEAQPDIRGLALLGKDAHLVTADAPPNGERLIQLPSVDKWQVSDVVNLTTSVTAPAGWDYRVVRLDTGEPVDPSTPGDVTTVVTTTASGAEKVQLSLALGGDLVVDDQFSKGQWQPVADCYDVLGPSALSDMRGTLFAVNFDGVQRALRLSTTVDSACESRTFLPPADGKLLVSAWVRHVAGLPPRLSLWESGPNRFVPMPAAPSTPGWSHYRAAVTLDPGTTLAQLFVHSDADSTGRQTVNEYAHVEAWRLPSLPSLALLGTPSKPAGPAPLLFVDRDSYSDAWQGPAGAAHVRVDGLLNGWLVTSPVASSAASYGATAATMIAAALSVVGVLVLAGLFALDLRRRRGG